MTMMGWRSGFVCQTLLLLGCGNERVKCEVVVWVLGLILREGAWTMPQDLVKTCRLREGAG
jgi:hypothetical protein